MMDSVLVNSTMENGHMGTRVRNCAVSGAHAQDRWAVVQLPGAIQQAAKAGCVWCVNVNQFSLHLAKAAQAAHTECTAFTWFCLLAAFNQLQRVALQH